MIARYSYVERLFLLIAPRQQLERFRGGIKGRRARFPPWKERQNMSRAYVPLTFR
jgi:hypothetical protein